MKIFNKRIISILLKLATTGVAGGILVVAGALMYLVPKLPSVDQLRDVHLQTPLKVYASNGELIGEFGEQRRSPVSFQNIPDHFISAIISAEDDNFFGHGGVDLMGLLRAASQIVTTGGIQSGGSTITMQVARNFFLSLEQTFTRKFNEILLALEIEHELSKEEILELYANKIYLGKSAYGVQAAANVYYGKDIGDLSLAQLAMIAGLPKAPSSSNPINNPDRALERRNWILGRMLHLGHIDDTEYASAIEEPVTASYHGSTITLDAPYVAEMVRAEMLDRFGIDAYEAGFEVYTTIDADLQRASDEAVREGAFTYDFRHGYRGPEGRFTEVEMADMYWVQQYIDQLPVVSGLVPAVVTEIGEQTASVLGPNGLEVEFGWESDLSNFRRYRTESWQSEYSSINEMLSVGDLVRLGESNGIWHLSQIPDVQAGLVAVDPQNGAIRALTGGVDFHQSHFNRMVSAKRQPGSNIKPFLYAAALENGYTAASLINDAPIIFQDAALEDYWRPENDSGVFYGPTRLRKALYLSRNLVSVRILRGLGIDVARESIMGYGFEQEDLPYNLTLALGSQGLEAVKLATGYSLFANGGYRVESHIISEILDRDGEVVFQANPPIACSDCSSPLEDQPSKSQAGFESSILEQQIGLYSPEQEKQKNNIADQVMDPRVSYIMDSILKDVIAKGTGTRAQALGRQDIAGKTGTSNGPRDSWFSGYSPDLVATSWVGFDDNSLLGVNEFGGTAALPIWIDFMGVALDGLPEQSRPQPEGLVTVLIDPDTGERAPPGTEGAIFELFLAENAPALLTEQQLEPGEETGNITDSLF